MATTILPADRSANRSTANIQSGDSILLRRWQGGQHPNLTLLTRQLEAEGLRPYRWQNGPHFRHAVRSLRSTKVLYCVQGQLTVVFPDLGQEATLYPGDRLEIARGIRHGLVVGAAGVECVESERPTPR